MSCTGNLQAVFPYCDCVLSAPSGAH